MRDLTTDHWSILERRLSFASEPPRALQYLQVNHGNYWFHIVVTAMLVCRRKRSHWAPSQCLSLSVTRVQYQSSTGRQASKSNSPLRVGLALPCLLEGASLLLSLGPPCVLLLRVFRCVCCVHGWLCVVSVSWHVPLFGCWTACGARVARGMCNASAHYRPRTPVLL